MMKIRLPIHIQGQNPNTSIDVMIPLLPDQTPDLESQKSWNLTPDPDPEPELLHL